MSICDVPCAEAGEVGKDRAHRTGLSGRAIEHHHRRQAAIHRRPDFRHPLQDLGEQVRAAFGEGVGKEDRAGEGGAVTEGVEGAAEVVAELFGVVHVIPTGIFDIPGFR